MKTKFYIDRQFGHAIWLDVEDGIFIGCTHKGEMEEKITEKYKGLPISKVKELYEKAFEGVYTCIHNGDYTGLLAEHFSWNTKMKFKWSCIHSIERRNTEYGKEEIERLKKEIDEYREKQYQVELKLRDKWIELKNIHGFVFYEKKFHHLVGELK